MHFLLITSFDQFSLGVVALPRTVICLYITMHRQTNCWLTTFRFDAILRSNISIAPYTRTIPFRSHRFFFVRSVDGLPCRALHMTKIHFKFSFSVQCERAVSTNSLCEWKSFLIEFILGVLFSRHSTVISIGHICTGQFVCVVFDRLRTGIQYITSFEHCVWLKI